MLGHFPELIIILVIALIVFGPEKLPEAAASAGKALREMRQVMDSATHPPDEEESEDFSTYYYESLERSGEDFPPVDEEYDPYDEVEAEYPGELPTEIDAPAPLDARSPEAIHAREESHGHMPGSEASSQAPHIE